MRAISPLVATAILLIITVAGGVMLYNYMFNALSSPQDYSSLAVSSATMLVDNGTMYVNIKATNVGTREAIIKYVIILPENITIKTSQIVGPGETKGFTLVYTIANRTINTERAHYVIVGYDDQETEPIRMRVLR